MSQRLAETVAIVPVTHVQTKSSVLRKMNRWRLYFHCVFSLTAPRSLQTVYH